MRMSSRGTGRGIGRHDRRAAPVRVVGGVSQFFWMLAAALLGALLSRPIERGVYSLCPELWIRARNRYRMLRYGRKPLSSWAGWIGDTRHLHGDRKVQMIVERLDEAQLLSEQEAPYGIPYMKMKLAHELGMTVFQFDSLPYKEQLAWQAYFTLPEASRDGFYNRRIHEAIDKLRDEGILEPSRVLRCSWSGCRGAQVENAMCEDHAREWRKRHGVRSQ